MRAVGADQEVRGDGLVAGGAAELRLGALGICEADELGAPFDLNAEARKHLDEHHFDLALRHDQQEGEGIGGPRQREVKQLALRGAQVHALHAQADREQARGCTAWLKDLQRAAVDGERAGLVHRAVIARDDARPVAAPRQLYRGGEAGRPGAGDEDVRHRRRRGGPVRARTSGPAAAYPPGGRVSVLRPIRDLLDQVHDLTFSGLLRMASIWRRRPS